MMYSGARMHLTVGQSLLVAASVLLEAAVLVFAFRRRLYSRFPLFTSYLALMVIRTLAGWGLYLALGYDSRPTFYFFWVTQGILVAARAAVIVELAWGALRAYQGIWGMGRTMLCLLTLFLLLHAGIDARNNVSLLAGFVVTLERGLELAVVGILVFLLGFCRYYGVRLEPVQKMIALGLGFYSAIQVLNNTVWRQWLALHFPAWAGVRVVAFQVALVIWLLALRKPLPAAAPAPALLPQSVYDELSPQVNYRLRALNDRLLEILKS